MGIQELVSALNYLRQEHHDPWQRLAFGKQFRSLTIKVGRAKSVLEQSLEESGSSDSSSDNESPHRADQHKPSMYARIIGQDTSEQKWISKDWDGYSNPDEEPDDDPPEAPQGEQQDVQGRLAIACRDNLAQEAGQLVSCLKDPNILIDANILIAASVDTDREAAAPIHIAARHNAMAVLDAVLADKRVRTDVLDATGRTALHWAAVNENESMFNSLIQRGADRHFLDKQGVSPQHIWDHLRGTDALQTDVLHPRVADGHWEWSTPSNQTDMGSRGGVDNDAVPGQTALPDGFVSASAPQTDFGDDTAGTNSLETDVQTLRRMLAEARVRADRYEQMARDADRRAQAADRRAVAAEERAHALERNAVTAEDRSEVRHPVLTRSLTHAGRAGAEMPTGPPQAPQRKCKPLPPHLLARGFAGLDKVPSLDFKTLPHSKAVTHTVDGFSQVTCDGNDNIAKAALHRLLTKRHRGRKQGCTLHIVLFMKKEQKRLRKMTHDTALRDLNRALQSCPQPCAARVMQDLMFQKWSDDGEEEYANVVQGYAVRIGYFQPRCLSNAMYSGGMPSGQHATESRHHINRVQGGTAVCAGARQIRLQADGLSSRSRMQKRGAFTSQLQSDVWCAHFWRRVLAHADLIFFAETSNEVHINSMECCIVVRNFQLQMFDMSRFDTNGEEAEFWDDEKDMTMISTDVIMCPTAYTIAEVMNLRPPGTIKSANDVIQALKGGGASSWLQISKHAMENPKGAQAKHKWNFDDMAGWLLAMVVLVPVSTGAR